MRSFAFSGKQVLPVIALLLIATSQLQAQRNESDADSLEIHALLNRLCAATAMQEHMELCLGDLIRILEKRGVVVSDDYYVELKGMLRCADLLPALVPIYRSVFTSEELDDVVRFFECPQIQNHYRQLLLDTNKHFFLGNDLIEVMLSIDSCTESRTSPGMTIWENHALELGPAVSQLLFDKLDVIMSKTLNEISPMPRRPKPASVTLDQMRSEAAAIDPKKYADIARCLKGSGFREFLILSLERDANFKYSTLGERRPPEMIEGIGRLTELAIRRIDEDSVIAIIAPVFDTSFTAKEMKSIADFYQTRAGKSYVQIKLRQFREPMRTAEIFMEEFNKLPSKEQNRLTGFRETDAANRFIEPGSEMSATILSRLLVYISAIMKEAAIDLIEDADSNE